MLIIAIGNSFRGDDGVGLEVAGRLRALQRPDFTVVEALGDVGLIDTWSGEDSVLVVDAVQSGTPPGTVLRLDLNEHPLPREWFRLSSHQVGVADAVELARRLHKLPRRFIFVGIEGARFEHGTPMSPAVSRAVDEAVAAIMEDAGLKPEGFGRRAQGSRLKAGLSGSVTSV